MLTIVILVGVSVLQMWPTPSQQWVGVITDIDADGIRVGNEMNPEGIWIDLSRRTRLDGDPRALRRDTPVRVFYARTGGGAVARRVSILTGDPRRPLRQPQKDLRQ
jgi:hypothetical protein